MKSLQTINVDFNDQTEKVKITQKFKTGTTDFFGVTLNSVRDKFKVTGLNFDSDDFLIFTAIGETASGIGVAPNINYRFKFEARPKGDDILWKITGCHDGYPAYKITINSLVQGGVKTVAYNFKHKSIQLFNLFGECDIKTNVTKLVKS